MTTPGTADQHVQVQLGLYVLDALPPDERRAVDEHLAGCEPCRRECAQLRQVLPFMQMLELGDVEDLAAPRPRPAAPADAAPATATPADRPPRPAERAPARKTRPAGKNGPAGKPRPRRRLLSRFGVVLAGTIVVALLAGLGIGLLLRVSGPVAITLDGTEANAATGVRMSVTVVSDGDDHSKVTARIRGLTQGSGYQLIAATKQGQTRMVAQWVADRQLYDYQGDLPLAAANVAFFSVARQDGAVLVTVKVE
ncbi:zf-HC2 domain-containing protein [Dactylosporangium sp. CA-092794]|uniref:zf-HC2 domain-containing protein n=1 Tax=Dactylosporangium sp. CA-092794 TaxID=3239929 RepID=UPI003D8B723E